MNRRSFLGAAAAAAAAPRIGSSANDAVTIALIGAGGRCQTLSKWFADLPDVRISPVICDVDQNVAGPVMQFVQEKYGKPTRLVNDMRRVFDDKSVDAVVIATHCAWHAAATIMACDAGKDVYVEKPMSHDIREGRLMVEAAQRNKRIVQIGTQSRSRPVTQRFIEYVQSGKLGKVLMVKAWNVQMRKDLGHKPDEPAPAGVDYDTWTGPVPMLPFNRNRYHAVCEYNWHYGTGDVGADGSHWLDIARWALGVDYPREVYGMGRKLYFDDDQQTPDTMNITYDYNNSVIQYEQRSWNRYRLEGSENSVAAYGSDGMAVTGRWNGGLHAFKVYDNRGQQIIMEEEAAPDTNLHPRNFIDCIRSRKPANANPETAQISNVLVHLSNIVARTGRPVRFDPATNTVIGDADANRYVRREYRKHWSTPKGV